MNADRNVQCAYEYEVTGTGKAQIQRSINGDNQFVHRELTAPDIIDALECNIADCQSP